MAEPTETSPSTRGCCDWPKGLDDLRACTEKIVHDDPSKAIGLAMLGGVLLTILPVGRLISALVRLTFALARPLLLVLGVVKLYDECQRSRKQ